MTGLFLIDAVRRARTPVTPFRQSMGDLVENFFRPSESVTNVGSFDSVRLTPHSAHDDSGFFDGRSSTGGGARRSMRQFWGWLRWARNRSWHCLACARMAGYSADLRNSASSESDCRFSYPQ